MLTGPEASTFRSADFRGSLPSRPGPPSDRVGPFLLLAPLGKGGMGTVYEALHVRSDQRVAVKVLHETLVKDPKILARFLAEARALNVARDPHIVEVLDIGTSEDGRPWFAMELLRGRSLGEVVGRPQPPGFALPILAQICVGLSAAHGAGIIHRDLKPQNVFLVERGEACWVKLLDFGIAKILAPGLASRKTTVGTLIGTPDYMAPEQCDGGEVDARADLYSVGVLSYLLSTGKLPFPGLPLTELLVAHRLREPPPPRSHNAQIPVAWERLTLKALAKRPDRRQQSAAELREELKAALGR
jgi:serine/threonine protein kinase